MKRIGGRVLGSLLALSLAGGLLSGCASPTPKVTEYFPHSGKIRVLSSVAVWANIAQEIGGSEVASSAIIADPSRDPHSYEASVRDQLAVNRADITLANGAGYDSFFSKLVNQRPAFSPIENFEIAQRLHSETANPHFWYSISKTMRAAQAILIAETMAAKTQNQAIRIQDRAAAYRAKLQDLATLEQTLKAQNLAAAAQRQGKTALLTEPFAAYLLADLGITDLTPNAFRNAVEQEQDASPAVMLQMRTLLAKNEISVLVLNSQTAGSQTAQLEKWAKQAGVPVLHWSELLPEHTSYLSWMTDNLSQIEGALK